MGFFNKIFSALKKTKDSFSEKMRQLFARDKIGEDFYEDLEDILITSDISVTTAEEIVENLRDRMIEEKAKDKDYVVEELKGSIRDCLDMAEDLEIETPAVIMVIGVNGVGKTTTIGKIASRLRQERKKVLLAAADTFRAAAIEQLEVWAERSGSEIVKHPEGSDPASVVYDAIAAAKSRGTDVVICDTAGRLHNKKNLMDELAKINRIIDRELPDADKEVLLVLDATTGQNAVNQAREFQNVANLTGIVLTKLDGTARGGVVLAIREELKLPVKFIGVGEQVDDLQPFDAKAFSEALFTR